MKTSVFATFLLAAAISQAQTSPQALSLGGTTQYDGWANFNPTTFPGTGNFPGTGSWTSPLGSNTSGSGDATLNKTANGTGGGPYVASSSIYFGGFSGVQNTNGGKLAVTDTTVVSNLKTVIFQLEIGEAFGYDLYNHGDASLSYTYIPTGSTTPTTGSFLTTTFTSLLAHVDTGLTFNDPTTGKDEPLFRNLRSYQWDFSGIAGTVTSFSVSFTGVQHAQVYALQLDQSSQAYGSSVFAAPVPEPATMGALAIGALGVLRRRRKA